MKNKNIVEFIEGFLMLIGVFTLICFLLSYIAKTDETSKELFVCDEFVKTSNKYMLEADITNACNKYYQSIAEDAISNCSNDNECIDVDNTEECIKNYNEELYSCISDYVKDSK